MTGSATCRASPSRLTSLAALGVDAVWLSPFFSSPQVDAGYDVSDYCDVDPVFGTLADLDALLARAHDLGLKVIVDLVPNHTSDQHPWFRAALADGPGSPARARYHFRDEPTDWQSVFGGPAWTRVPDGQSYLHLYDPAQPDLNWANPEVRAEFERILRFWLDRGVDGFRVDVAHGLVKDPTLPVVRRQPAGPAGQARTRRTGTRTGCTTSTGPGERSSTPTRPPTRVGRGSCAARPTWPSSGRSATCARTSCTRPSTSPTCRRRWSRWRCAG